MIKKSFLFLLLITFYIFVDIVYSNVININYNNDIRSFDRVFAFGNNVACWGGWQKYVKHKEMIEASGSCYFVRYPGGSTSNQYHWNGEGYYDDEGIWHPSSTTFKTGFICWPTNNATRYDSYGDGEPSKLLDGRLDTSWISYPGLKTPQWIYVNFGTQKTCDRVTIYWGEQHYATKYKIQYWSAGTWPWPYNSKDDKWVDLLTVENSTGGVQTHQFTSTTRTIFRVLMLESSTDRYEIREIYFLNGTSTVTVNVNNYRTQTDCIASSMFPSNHKRANQWIPDFDFERFMEWCNSFTRGKVYPIITINMGTGTPEEAAAWVYYANVVKGYGIKYWEINNEISGHWEIGGPLSAKDYAQRAIKFIEAMKSVDPTIEVIVTGGCSPEEWSHSYDNKRYIEAILEEFYLAGKAHLIDIVGCHWYPYWQNDNEATALSKTELWDTWGPSIREWIGRYLPNPNKVKVSISEYSSGGATANTCKLMEALFTVDWVLNFIKNGGDMTNKWDVFNGLAVGPDGTYGDHAFMENGLLTGEYAKYAYQPRSSYWALFMLYNLFSSSTTNTLVEATSSLHPQLLKVYANKRADNVLSIIVVNKDSQNSYPITINVSGFNPQSYAHVFTFDSNNYVWHDRGVNSHADPSDPPTVSTISVSSQFSYTFSSYSITLINLYRANAKVDHIPKVVFMSPVKNQKVHGDFLVKVKAEDDNEIKQIQLYIDNILVHQVEDTEVLEYSWNTLRYPNGKHFLRAICYDNSNQVGIVQIYCVVENQIELSEYLIDDCEDGDTQNFLGGHWFNYDDRWDNGNSRVSPYPLEMTPGGAPGSSQYCAYMSWTLGSAIQWPYVGLGMNFIDNSVYDLSEYDGISFYFKGNQPYQLILRMPQDGTENGWASYRVQFSSSSEWVKKVFYWQDFHLPSWSPNKEENYPLDLTKIQNIIFQPAEGLTAGASGEIFVDNICLVKKVASSQQLNKYKLTVEINPENSGIVEIQPTSVDGYYLEGTTVILRAIPNSGWAFKRWSGDLESTQDTISIIINSTKTIVAMFEILQDTTSTSVILKKKYLLTFDSNGKNDVIEFGDNVESVKVYDIKGNLVYEARNHIDASSKLKVGIYIYKAKFKDGKIRVGSIYVLK